MTDREKLIQLLDKGLTDVAYIPGEFPDTESLADYLLINCVLLLPCKIGQTCYGIIESFRCDTQHCPFGMDDIGCIECKYSKHRFTVEETIFTVHKYYDFGHTIFPTKEEAEKALEEYESNA